MSQALQTKGPAKGSVVKAYGNLLQVKFDGHIRQGEVAMARVDGTLLKGEVIEIVGDEAKIQIYEDTSGVKLNTEITFEDALLEAELGPGLLTSIFDGLQNPLEPVADASGLFLPRGVYLPAIGPNIGIMSPLPMWAILCAEERLWVQH